MLRKVRYNHSERERLYLPVLLPLLNGLTQAQGLKGEVIVMDVADASILCFAALHDASVLNSVTPEERKSYGEGVFCASRVKSADFVGIETEEGYGYVEWSGSDFYLPIETIMPAVSYLSFVECGFQPSDLLEWDGGSATLEDAFVEGEFAPLVNAIMQLCPDGIVQLWDYMSNIGILSCSPNNNPRDLQEIIHNELSPDMILDWICQVAMGEGLVNQFPEKDEEPGSLAVSAEGTQMLKEVLKKSGAESITKAAADEENRIGGYTYVTEPDTNNNRCTCLFGYFPVDEPKYGISVWFQRKEQAEDDQVKEQAELKAYAADICKRIVDYMMSSETDEK